jgi:hypothetical protein
MLGIAANPGGGGAAIPWAIPIPIGGALLIGGAIPAELVTGAIDAERVEAPGPTDAVVPMFD